MKKFNYIKIISNGCGKCLIEIPKDISLPHYHRTIPTPQV
jgi:hypothetical protein